MKLIEEIKKAEETAEKLKKDAYREGQKRVEKEREAARQALADLGDEKETRFANVLSEAQGEVEKLIEEMETEHKKEIAKLRETARKNKKQALKKVQETIITWPSSQ